VSSTKQYKPASSKALRAVLGQRGISLLFALLALAALSLAAVALVRSVDSGSLVIGNLGFKQDTTHAAALAAEDARSYLTAGTRDLSVNGASGSGYYASLPANLDPTGRLTTAANPMEVVNWGEADSCSCRAAGTCSQCVVAPSAEQTYNGGAVRARYLITRMCPTTGVASSANACAQPADVTPAQKTQNSVEDYNNQTLTAEAVPAPYYRIVVRTVGARNTVSFTETIIH
jgi:type IV pilus assembly protein PilX